MNILVCVKRVPLTGGKIVLTDDRRAISTRHLGFTISPHEECACEEAVRLIEQHGGSSTVLTLGPPEAEEQLRDMMAIGIDSAIHLVTDATERMGSPGHGERDRGRYRGRAGAVRPAPVRQRVGRRRQLPGGHPGGPPAEPPGRDRDQRRSPSRTAEAFAASRRCRAAAMSTSDAAGRGHGQGGDQPAALPVGARTSARQAQAAQTDSPSRPPSRLEMVELSLPPGSGKQAEVLGDGAGAAPAVVGVLHDLGLV